MRCLDVVFFAFAVVFLFFAALARRIRGSVFNILQTLFFVAFLVAALMFLLERRKEFPTSQGSKRFSPEIVLENVFLATFFVDPPRVFDPRVFDLVFFFNPPWVPYPS